MRLLDLASAVAGGAILTAVGSAALAQDAASPGADPDHPVLSLCRSASAETALQSPERDVVQCAAAALLAIAAEAAVAQGDVAADDDGNPVDAALTACLDAGATTADYTGCSAMATGAWNRVLVRTYDDLLATLDPGSRDLLAASQRQWLAAREADQAFWGGPWRDGQGTIMSVILSQENADQVKQRVRLLQAYSGG